MINKTFFCLFLLLSINTYGQFKADSTYMPLNVATSRVSAGIDGSLYLLSKMFNMGSFVQTADENQLIKEQKRPIRE